MCNLRAFCIYQTLLKDLVDKQINQIKISKKLILRSFCLVIALSCNNDTRNMITIFTIWVQFLLWLYYETFHLNQNSYLGYRKNYGNSLMLTQKNTCRGGLRALSNMSKLLISLKSLVLAQNSNNIKTVRKFKYS